MSKPLYFFFTLIMVSYAHSSYAQVYKTDDFKVVFEAPIPIITYPQFKGGKEGLDQYLKDQVKVPIELNKLDKTGVVVLFYKVNTKGKVVEVKVDENSSTLKKEFHEIVIKALTQSGPWKPGISSGKTVISLMEISFRFVE